MPSIQALRGLIGHLPALLYTWAYGSVAALERLLVVKGSLARPGQGGGDPGAGRRRAEGEEGMRIQRAVILAAGNGSRMGALTATIPKPLLSVGGRTLIDRQLDALKWCGVMHVAVVVGHHEQRFRRHLGRRAAIVHNERYRETNSLYSLWLAADHLECGAFVLNGDVVFTPPLLERLKWHPAPDALLFEPRRTLGPEEMKVRLAGSHVVDMSKDMPAALAAGENVGLLKFGPGGGSRLRKVLHALVAAGEVNARASRAVVEVAQRRPIAAVDTGGLPWTEVDYPEDLQYADRVVAAEIDASIVPPAFKTSVLTVLHGCEMSESRTP